MFDSAKEFFSILIPFAGFGVLIDRIFITDVIRLKIEDHLTTPREDNSLFVRYKKTLQLSESIIFGKYFSGKISSFKFLLPSIALSSISFFLAVAFQFIFFPKFAPDLSLNTEQTLVMLSFFAFNLFGDIVTIAQTRAFIQAAAKSESPLESAIFFTTDIIATINIFILLYAAFLLAFIQIYTSTPKTAGFLAFEKSAVLTQDGELKREWPGRFEEREIYFSISLPDSAPRKHKLTVISKKPLTNREILSALALNSTSEVRLLSIGETATEPARNIVNNNDAFILAIEDEREFKSQIESGEILSDAGPDGTTLARRKTFKFEIDLRGPSVTLSNVNRIYTPAFNTVDIMEDSFPLSIVNGQGWISVEEFIEIYVGNAYFDWQQDAGFCSNAGYTRLEFGDFSYAEGQENSIFPTPCENEIVIKRDEYTSNASRLAKQGRESDVLLPFSPMFLTSIIPTFALYLALIAVSLSTFSHRIAIKNAAKFGDFIIQSPVGFAMFALGFVFAVVNLFFSI